ncbi:hypothetical protein SFA35_08660 [Pseudomonas sp. HR96]|uniref:hypothetical protein n=1 Tax=Pseudomonas sp. HR96 TaxID=1027966 RepID=UPI002A75171A|nr:hypothetical protein [Pseudomonas sp. HR96]WPP01414.1 hypothetical protein SFA35_08660 [Pseudomonas sp. HR96]
MKEPRYVSLNLDSSSPAILHIDAEASLPDMLDFADHRFRMARQLLASLEGADDCDLRQVSNAARVLLEDGCGVMGLIEERLATG